MSDPPAAPLPGGPQPTARDLQQSNDLLRELQLILGGMGKDDRRKSPEFQELMGIYKSLGGDLHEARKRVPVAPIKGTGGTPGTLPVRATGALAPRQVPSGPLPTSAPGQARPVSPTAGSVTALGRTAQAYGSKPAAPGVPTAAASAAETKVTLEAAGTGVAGQAAAAYGAKPSPAVPAVTPQLPAATAVTPQAAAAGAAALAAQAYGTSPAAPPAVVPEVQQQEMLPPPLPLQMPKFKSALGPPSPKTVYRGPEVDNLQILLAHIGYPVERTGSFDIPTLRAVNMLQKKNKIPVTQVVGMELRKLLNDMVTG